MNTQKSSQPFSTNAGQPSSLRMRAAIIRTFHLPCTCDRQHFARRAPRQRVLDHCCHAYNLLHILTVHAHVKTSLHTPSYILRGIMAVGHTAGNALTHLYGLGARAASHSGKLDITRANHILMLSCARYLSLIATAFCKVTF